MILRWSVSILVAITVGCLPVLAAGAQNFDLDLPAEEHHMGDLFEQVPAFDGQVLTFGRADGRAAVLVLEDFQLQCLGSVDGGNTFSSELIVAGGPGQKAVRSRIAATLADDGTLYVAFPVADPSGEIGIQFARSDDMGQTWTAPLDLLGAADDHHGTSQVYIAAASGGRVAVAYRWRWGNHPFVRVSTDAGVSWTNWVRVDAGVAEGSGKVTDIDLAIDGAGNVHVVYTDDRGSGRELFHTRSTDAGLNFESEKTLDSALPPGERSGAQNPDVAIAADGGVLIAFWDSYEADRFYVVRSADAGQTFQLSMSRSLSGTNRQARPVLGVDPGFPVVVAGMVEPTEVYSDLQWGPLTVDRSADHGASFGMTETLASEVLDVSAFSPISFACSADGNWAVGWRDGRHDTYRKQLADMYARVLPNGETSWEPEERINQNVGFATIRVSLGNITRVNASDVLAAYCDSRDDHRDVNVYVNRSETAALDFSTDEQRVDSDPRTRNIEFAPTATLASDGANRVYVALQGLAGGHYHDIYVASSNDGGYTFGTPRRVSTSAEGEVIDFVPQVAADADGNVYAAYKEEDTAFQQTLLRFNRSADFGVTWETGDQILGTAVLRSGIAANPEFRLAAQPAGRVYVAWSDGTDVFLARSTNGGTMFTIEDVDQDDRAIRQNGEPTLCVQGDQLVLAFVSPAADSPNSPAIWATVSGDAGQTWDTAVELRSPGNASSAGILPNVACGNIDKAVVVWSDRRTGRYTIHSNRFDGSAWEGDVDLGTGGNFDQIRAEALFALPTHLVVAYQSGSRARVSVSTDGGSSFPVTAALDNVATLNVDAQSWRPNLAGDGLGNVWASWLEYSAGLPSVAVRHSANGGLTFGPVRRLNRELPQGTRVNEHWYAQSHSVALPNVALFAWGGERSSFRYDVMINAYDLDDFDRDQVSSLTDCDDENPGLIAVPLEVAGMALERVTGATRLSWTSQSATAGSATVYDVVTGTLGELRGSGSFSAATCLQSDVAGAFYDDLRGGPDPGEGDYYLVRSENDCGVATFGSGVRFLLDLSSTCP